MDFWNFGSVIVGSFKLFVSLVLNSPLFIPIISFATNNVLFIQFTFSKVFIRLIMSNFIKCIMKITSMLTLSYFLRETMCFWDLCAPWLEPLRGPNGLEWILLKIFISDIESERPTSRCIHNIMDESDQNKQKKMLLV